METHTAKTLEKATEPSLISCGKKICFLESIGEILTKVWNFFSTPSVGASLGSFGQRLGSCHEMSWSRRGSWDALLGVPNSGVLMLKITGRIYLLVAAAMIPIASMAALAVVEVNNTRLDMRQHELKALVDVATSVAQAQYDAAQAGTISQADAQKAALATISSMRYSGKEYMFVSSPSGVMLMHPIRPEMNGTDQSKAQDPNGKFLFMEMAEVATKQGSGFVDYQWPRAAETEPVDHWHGCLHG